MSREITIGYRLDANGPETAIEVRPPYYLLGTQRTSKQLWSIPRLREVGIIQLAELGETDPVYFIGWDMMADLWREIGLLQQHLRSEVERLQKEGPRRRWAETNYRQDIPGGHVPAEDITWYWRCLAGIPDLTPEDRHYQKILEELGLLRGQPAKSK